MKVMKFMIPLTFGVLVAFQGYSQQKSSNLTAHLPTSGDSVQTGGVKMVNINTPVGKFKVWTKTFGKNSRIKLLLLHGGPAVTHEYMECFESFMPKEGFELIEYDQLGSHYSDQPADSTLWTISRFVEEVEQVRKALDLDSSNFYLLGHSWGGMLALDYALKYQHNLKGLILSDAMASSPAYEKYNAVLRSKMDKGLIEKLKSYEDKGLYTDSTYQALVFQNYYLKHLCRLSPWPEPQNRTFRHINNEIYVMMQGPSEFKTGGRLMNWDRSKELNKITIPTLTIGAKYDTMDPEYMKWMSTQVKNGEFLYCPNGSHLCMYDDQQVYMNGVIKFIKQVDARK